MSLKDRQIAFLNVLHKLQIEVFNGNIPSGVATRGIENILYPQVYWWVESNRYPQFAEEPLTPELIGTWVDQSLETSSWEFPNIPPISSESSIDIGYNIYRLLSESDDRLLGLTPSIDTLNFFESNPPYDIRELLISGYRIFAWRDAVTSNRHPYNILIKSLFVNRQGLLDTKWVTIQDIGKFKHRILIRIK